MEKFDKNITNYLEIFGKPRVYVDDENRQSEVPSNSIRVAHMLISVEGPLI